LFGYATNNTNSSSNNLNPEAILLLFIVTSPPLPVNHRQSKTLDLSMHLTPLSVSDAIATKPNKKRQIFISVTTRKAVKLILKQIIHKLVQS
jgi:hypothetical protein